tara:strand:- start:1295 stop:1597 length:303 start_codon:yes stop_codon:yes gene_type:complete
MWRIESAKDILKLSLLIIVAASLASCERSTASEVAALTKHVQRNQVGSGPDYWLELHNMSGDWEKVALVMGYYDDYDGCQDIASSLHERFGRDYRCAPAN